LRALVAHEVPRIAQSNLTAHVALGLHPNARPRRAHLQLWDELPELLEHDAVVAVGECAAFEDTAADWELLDRHIECANSAALPLVVTTPKTLRVNMAYKMMEVFDDRGVAPERVMFLGLDAPQLSTTLATGHYACVSLGPFGLDTEALHGVVEALLVEDESATSARLVCSSGLRSGGGDVLALAKARDVLFAAGFGEARIARWTGENARVFYGV